MIPGSGPTSSRRRKQRRSIVNFGAGSGTDDLRTRSTVGHRANAWPWSGQREERAPRALFAVCIRHCTVEGYGRRLRRRMLAETHAWNRAHTPSQQLRSSLTSLLRYPSPWRRATPAAVGKLSLITSFEPARGRGLAAEITTVESPGPRSERSRCASAWRGRRSLS